MSSYYEDILNAVVEQIRTIPDVPTVDLRFDTIIYEQETVPLVIVAPDTDTYEKVAEQAFGQVVWWDYPVNVALVWPGNRVVKAQLASFLALRQAIRDVIFKPLLSGVSTVMNSFVNPHAATKLSALSNSNYRVTGWGAVYRNNEERSV